MEYTISLKAHRKIIDKYKKDIEQNERLSKEISKSKKIIENKDNELSELSSENDKLKSEVRTLNEKLGKLDKIKEKPTPGSDSHDRYVKKYPYDYDRYAKKYPHGIDDSVDERVYRDKYYTISTDNTSGYTFDPKHITVNRMHLDNDKSKSDKSESMFSIKSIFKKIREII